LGKKRHLFWGGIVGNRESREWRGGRNQGKREPDAEEEAELFFLALVVITEPLQSNW